jgi:hypothetical protein
MYFGTILYLLLTFMFGFTLEKDFRTHVFCTHFVLMVTYIKISGFTRRSFVEYLFVCCNHIFLHV